jgi:hypothetical protein
MHGGVDVKWRWRAFLFWICMEVIMVRFKISRGNDPLSPMEIDSADTIQQPNGEICMDKSHLLPNNPARQ